MTFVVSRIQARILASGQTVWQEIEETVAADQYTFMNEGTILKFENKIEASRVLVVCFYPLTEIKKVRLVSE